MGKLSKAQGLVEYVLVFLFATIVMYYAASRIDLSTLKSFAIRAFRSEQSNNSFVVPPMTD